MRDLLIRLALGSPCLLIAVWFFRDGNDPQMSMLIVFPCLLAYGLIIFPATTTMAADAWTSLFLPNRESAPRPELKHALELRVAGKPELALLEYERLAEKFPTDPKLWNACFEIAWIELNDPDRAADCHAQALIWNGDPDLRKRISHFYQMQERRHAESGERTETASP